MSWRSVAGAWLLAAVLPASIGWCQPAPGANTAATGAASSPTWKTWASRQAAFNIPFSVESLGGSPAEVQLFVSQDAGQTWQFHSRQPATARHFVFRAPADGQYWFASRTIDPQRDVPRVENLQPELHVIVDTRPPQFEFTAVVGLAGEIKTIWKAADPALDTQTLKIEYQAEPNGVWRLVALDPTKMRQEPGSMVGELMWWPENAQGTVSIRAEIADAAGNRTVVNRQLTVTRTAQRPVSAIPTDPYAQQSPSGPGVMPAPSGPEAPSQGVTRWPSDNQLPTDVPPDANAAASRGYAESPVNPTNQQPAAGATGVATPGLTETFPVSTAGDTAPASDLPAASPAAAAPSAASLLPPGERASMTNSLQFQLEYQLDAVVPGGVEEVQLWGTTDYGKNWTRWQVDHDRQSPLDIEVEREGLYGFRVVIVGRNGLATPPPQPGDLADVWVGVDTTKPGVRITSASYGEGLHAGELDIRWQTIDDALGQRPITLLFSERADGPWTTIAAGLPDSGQYFWKIDPHTPAKVYLRIEVRDEAGNFGAHQLLDPLSTRGLVPQAIIRSVRPVTAPPPASPPPTE